MIADLIMMIIMASPTSHVDSVRTPLPKVWAQMEHSSITPPRTDWMPDCATGFMGKGASHYRCSVRLGFGAA